MAGAPPFWPILLALSTPGLSATAVLYFLFAWDDFLFPLMLTRTEVITAPVAVVDSTTYEGWEWGRIAAGGTMVMLPVLVFSLLVRKYLALGSTGSAVKGWRTDPTARRRLGRSALEVTALGFGAAPIGGFRASMTEAEAGSVINAAWREGVRIFDTSPFYGYGRSELRIGAALRDRPRDAYILSTKIGRVLRSLRHGEAPPPGLRIGGLPGIVPDFDYSYDGVMRAFEQSLLRLGLTRIDVLLVHDIDFWSIGDHDMLEARFRTVMDSGFRALDELRCAGATEDRLPNPDAAMQDAAQPVVLRLPDIRRPAFCFNANVTLGIEGWRGSKATDFLAFSIATASAPNSPAASVGAMGPSQCGTTAAPGISRSMTFTANVALCTASPSKAQRFTERAAFRTAGA